MFHSPDTLFTGNVAYNKLTELNGVAHRGPDPAVDGILQGDWPGDGCAYYRYNTSISRPRWQVDLGALYRVYNITLFIPDRHESKCINCGLLIHIATTKHIGVGYFNLPNRKVKTFEWLPIQQK